MTVSASNNVVLITGEGGWLGGILADALLADDPSTQLILADNAEPRAPKAAKDAAVTIKANLTDAGAIDGLFTTRLGIPGSIYCLHGILSRGPEDNFDLGLHVNVDSIRALLDRAHTEAERGNPEQDNPPIKFSFTSSLALYSEPLPDVVGSSTIATPGQLWVRQALERAPRQRVHPPWVRGRTTVVRPGPPSNATRHSSAASSASPSQEQAVCPVGDSLSSPALELAAWVASPETTIRNLSSPATSPQTN